MAGTLVSPHTAVSSNPDGLAEAQAATVAGMRASEERQAHYHRNVLGQGAQAGDPQDADSTLQSYPAGGPEPSVPGKSTL